MVAAVREPLDERLVEVALELLDREGIEAVTLRRIAREADVSHGAPFRHYRSRAVLLAHVAACGFRQLRDAVTAATDAVPDEAHPGEHLAASARAYIETAVAHPALFALMFRPEQLDWEVPELLEDSVAAFEQLVDMVRVAQAAGWHPEADTRVLAGASWAAAHGLASLWAQNAIQPVTENSSIDRAIAMTVEVMAGFAPSTAGSGGSQ